MKILFYVEPHPIRNSYTHFIDVAKNFALIAQRNKDLDIKLFANSQTLAELLREKLIHRNKVITTTRVEDELFSVFNVDWESVGKDIWLDLLNGGDTANYYLPILKRIWNIFPFDIIIYWGENGAIRLFQKEHHFTAIGMELGCTRPPFFNSIVMDVYGTNGSSVVPKLTIEQIADIVDHQGLSANEANYLYSGKDILSYEQQFQPMDTKLFSKLSTSQPKVFLPLQLFDDANLLKFSKYSNLSEVVLDVVPQLIEKGYLVIIKPHPSAKHREGANYANQMVYSSLLPWIDNIIWCDNNEINYNNIQLIQLADFVITVNSSVGFESLLLDKPCVVLGDAIYKPKGLFPNLSDILEHKFDLSKYQELSGYLRKFFLDGYLTKYDIWSKPQLFIEKIISLHKAYQKYQESPGNLARVLFKHKLEMDDYAKRDAFYINNILDENKRSKPSQIDGNDIDEKDIFLNAVTMHMLKTSHSVNISDFKKWLTDTFCSPEKRYQVLKDAKFVTKSYYLNHQDVLDAGYEDVTLHYAKHGGLEERRTPNKHIAAGTNINSLIKIFLEYAEKVFSEPEMMKNAYISEAELFEREKQLKHIKKQLNKRSNKIVVVAHLYYTNLIDDILSRLNNISQKFDLIITMPTWGTETITQKVIEKYPDALFYRCLNRGRDIGPFIDLLPIILEKQYDYGLKLHTKNGFFDEDILITDYSELWRKEFLNSLVGSDKRINEIILAFKNNSKINLIGTKPFFLSLEMYPYSDQGEFLHDTLNLKDLNPKQNGFFGGTMFWFRPEMMKPLVDANISLLSFGAENGAADGEIAHIIERVFGHLAVYNNGIVAGVNSDDLDDNTVESYLEPSKISLHQYFSERKLYLNRLLQKELIKNFSTN